MTVALVSCRANDGDPDQEILQEALAVVGIEGCWVNWDDPTVLWDSYELAVIRSTWDYVSRREEFLAWAATVPRLCNPYALLVANTDKRYLGDLERRGVRIVPTRFYEVGESVDFPTGNFVLKPSVGAGSIDAERFDAASLEAARQHALDLHAKGRCVLVQPYIDSVDEQGETALIYIDGEFAHAMNKAAMLNVGALDRTGLFMMEQMSRRSVARELVDLGHTVLANCGFATPLYARVDLVQTDDGWAVMELEMTEPSLFLSFNQPTAHQLAQAVARRCAVDQPH